MSDIMDTAVRKATRQDYQPPKQKHLATLVALTFQYPASSPDIVDLLEGRLQENSWIVSFKVLIILHTLMRDGNGDNVIAYMESRPSTLDTTRLREKSSGTVQIQNIYSYTAYLQERVQAYRELRVDHVKVTMRNKVGKLRHLSVADGLLKETMVLQRQIASLLQCNIQFDEGENGLSLYAFRLLVEDLLVLFQTVNEAIVNILEHYFAMPKPEARLSLDVYKRFARQTEQIVAYLNRARHLQHELQITIPPTRHAPLSLASALEEYLRDAPSPKPQVEPKKVQKPEYESTSSGNKPQQPKELIDFFTSLENEQTTVLVNPVSTPSFVAPQMTHASATFSSSGAHNPFRAPALPPVGMNNLLQPSNTGFVAPQPSMSISTSLTTSNPFRQSHTSPIVTPQESISTPNMNSHNLNGFQAHVTQPTPNNSSMLFTQQPQPSKYNPFAAATTTTTTTNSITPNFTTISPNLSVQPFYVQSHPW